jgi:hypothetical protein
LSAPTPAEFYRETIPRQFNRLLVEQERAVESAQRVLDAMRGVDATIRVDVRGAGGGSFFLNVAGGQMSAGDAPAHPPFLTLIQDREAFERVAREAGDSALGMLGGLSGLTGEMRLTAGRIRNLAGVQGCIEFSVTGENGFSLRTHFGPGPAPDEPQTRVRVDEQGYRDLREGRLDPQQAFMSGAIAVEGDLQLAMQLALAALSPD